MSHGGNSFFHALFSKLEHLTQNIEENKISFEASNEELQEIWMKLCKDMYGISHTHATLMNRIWNITLELFNNELKKMQISKKKITKQIVTFENREKVEKNIISPRGN